MYARNVGKLFRADANSDEKVGDSMVLIQGSRPTTPMGIPVATTPVRLSSGALLSVSNSVPTILTKHSGGAFAATPSQGPVPAPPLPAARREAQSLSENVMNGRVEVSYLHDHPDGLPSVPPVLGLAGKDVPYMKSSFATSLANAAELMSQTKMPPRLNSSPQLRASDPLLDSMAGGRGAGVARRAETAMPSMRAPKKDGASPWGGEGARRPTC